MEILLAIILGGFFGFALYMVGATDMRKLSNMLKLKDLGLAKSILFAIGLGSVLLSLFNLVGIFNVEHLSVKSMHSGVVIGGIIFGLGFGLAGSCPGTSIAGLGTKRFKQSLIIVIGGLIGAFVFSQVYGSISGLVEMFDFGKITLFKISDEYQSIFNSGYIGLLLMGIIFIAGGVLLPKKIIK